MVKNDNNGAFNLKPGFCLSLRHYSAAPYLPMILDTLLCLAQSADAASKLLGLRCDEPLCALLPAAPAEARVPRCVGLSLSLSLSLSVQADISLTPC